ncbi:MAG TPA: SDR family NAD(P)-dependent oxidoreductase [Desulfopila sp.]|nr:SDR family NAD(P)-dependent oxidoreductase [Desulfopila sp.]
MIFDFCDQHVIVTGATRGIGKAISIAFLQKGARVIGVYGGNKRAADQLQDEVRSLSGSLSLFPCDVSKETEVRQLFDHIEKKFNSLDILVNNAGIRRDSVVALMATDDWQRVLDVNLTGSFLMAKEAVLMMMQKKYGRIINITSPVSHLGFAGQANYAASKAGQVAMTRSLAKETARKKITVNCVSPGFIATDFIEDLSKEQLAAYKKMVPMRRFGTVEEVADTVLFLSSSAASYITGAVIDVNGGL